MPRRGLGQEDRIHKNFSGCVRQWEGFGRLNCAWWSYDASGENRDRTTGSLLKAKGLRPGKSDYEFKIIKKNIAHHIYIEFKIEKGKQSESQKEFEKTCSAVNESYYIARSVKEGVDILIKEGILKE